MRRLRNGLILSSVPPYRSATLGDIAGLLGGQLLGSPDILVTGVAISHDSVALGDLFVAVRGSRVDGHDFVEAAAERGAAAAVVSCAPPLGRLPGVVVADSRVARSRLAGFFCGDPSGQMTVVAVTGTNGKTTVHWLLSKLLGAFGHRSVRMGTLGVELEGSFHEHSLTTPDPLTLQRSLRRALDRGVTYASLEASSHGLDQGRLADVAIDVAIFTNLTRDHLDYHRDMESYFLAKSRLFDLLRDSPKAARNAVINIDDSYGRRLLSKSGQQRTRVRTYGFSSAASIVVQDYSQTGHVSAFVLAYGDVRYPIRTHAIGRHNALNFAAVFGAAISIGLPANETAAHLGNLEMPPGRLEVIGDIADGVFVDYASTPDALDKALKAVRPVAHGRLWVIFGCGGDKDTGKRPEMLRAAIDNSDVVVVTSDNSRSEEPEAIIRDILSGGGEPRVDPNRRRAIHDAIASLDDGDVLVIAGKGHEDYLLVGEKMEWFSDQHEAKMALAKRKARRSK